MKSPKEITEALKVIKDTCEASADCYSCPLKGNAYHNCGITQKTPRNWEINEPDEWKAF